MVLVEFRVWIAGKMIILNTRIVGTQHTSQSDAGQFGRKLGIEDEVWLFHVEPFFALLEKDASAIVYLVREADSRDES